MGSSQSSTYPVIMKFEAKYSELEHKVFTKELKFQEIPFTLFIKSDNKESNLGLMCKCSQTTNWRIFLEFKIEVKSNNDEDWNFREKFSQMFSFGENFTATFETSKIFGVKENLDPEVPFLIQLSLLDLQLFEIDPKLSSCDHVIKKLIDQNDELLQRLIKYEGELELHVVENSMLKIDQDCRAAETEHMERTRSRLLNQKLKYVQELKITKDVVRDLEKKLADSETELKQVKEENEKLQKKATDLEAEAIKLRLQRADLPVKMANVEKEMKNLKDTNLKLLENVVDFKNELKKLKDEKIEFLKKNKDLEHDSKKMKDESIKLQKKVADLEAESKKFKDENVENHKKATDLENESKILKNKNIELLKKVAELVAASEKIRNENIKLVEKSEEYSNVKEKNEELLRKIDVLEEQFKSMKTKKKTVRFSDTFLEDVSSKVIQVTSKIDECRFSVPLKLLRERCPKLLTISEFDKEAGQIEIDFASTTFQEMINFFNNKIVDNKDLDMLNGLLVIAKKYEIADMKRFCENCIAAQLTVDNAIDLILEYEAKDVGHLRAMIIKFMAKNIAKLRKTSKWKEFSKNNEILAEIVAQI